MKAILSALLILIFLSVGLGQKPFPISSEYDKFKDETLISTEYMRVYGSDWDSNPLELSVQFSFSGRKPSPPHHVLLYFWSATREWRFNEAPTLLAIADGQRLVLGQTARTDAKIHEDRYSVSVREQVAIYIPLELFQKLAQASSIEMQLGPIEFAFKDRQLATLRALAEKMKG